VSARHPWHGVLVATALPMREDREIDLDRYAEHVAWLTAEGCAGVTPNGSLGEYQTLSPAERSAVVRTAVSAVAPGATVLPGVAAYDSRQAAHWTADAAEAGCPGVMLLPPNAYRADPDAVVAHYREVAAVGLPIVAYNNPIDTKVDLTPELLARLHGEGLIVAVKEFTGDVRRSYQIAELAPGLEVLIGADDVCLELAVSGSPGWIAGFVNAFPRASVALFEAARAGDLAAAMPLYRQLHPLLRWDSRTEFVQAIKLSMDVVGRYGGPCRPPRFALPPAAEKEIREATEKALAAGLR
jgi:4-hydroxy-tetrahydrodipicolinate synthase